MPLRTVKTILQQIVSVYADDVYDELEEIDKASTSFVYQYLLRLVANNASARPTTAAVDSPARATPVEEAPASPSKLANGAANGNGSRRAASPETAAGGDIEMNQQLKAIFDTIGDPGRSREVS